MCQSVRAVSQQLALATQQMLSLHQWQCRAQQQAALYRVTHAIRSFLKLTDIFAQAAREVRDLVQVERVLIYKFCADLGLWVIQVDQHQGDEAANFVGLEISDSPDTFLHDLKQGTVLQVNAAEDDSGNELSAVLAKTFPGWWLVVPLQVDQQTWGALHCVQPTPWQQWQQDVTIAVADTLAIAIQQSMLYQQLQTANQQLQELAMLDGLTHIPNRRFFDDALHQEWQRAQREATFLGLILCDVDFFKRYNDTYGHHAGDDCLIAIAQLLKRTLRRASDRVARYGGEEFGLILPYTTRIGAVRVAEDIQTALQALAIPHETSEIAPYVTLSLGIACIQPDAQTSPTDLVNLADQALYRAKRQGRNRWAF